MRSKVSWWEAAIRGQRDGWLADSFRTAARLGSLGYRAGMRSRQAAYERGWLRVRRLPLPTICVGNITVGGTGKTPLVIRLVNDLQTMGLTPAVLLRGYKRANGEARTLIVRDGQRIHATVAEAGDEAMELAHRLPGICIGVGANRYATGQLILKKHAVDCIILDDGFQHYQLGRDLNIVAVDVTDPWGGGWLLPAGMLRESPDALRRADAVVLTRTGLVSPDRLTVLRHEVRSFMNDGAVIVESRHEPRALVPLAQNRELPLSPLNGKKILAVCGIGNPQAFETALRNLGAEVAGGLRLSDHGGRPGEVWRWIAQRRLPAQWVVMTEKDAMRWQGGSVDRDLLAHSYILRMDIELNRGESHWRQLMKRISSLRTDLRA